jgi:photosystem II stability/assembly factor-like uncharacterized protein
MNKNKFYKKLSSGIYYFSILLFIIGFNFSDQGSGGWQLQTMPFLNNRPLTDMTFTDSLTGFGITGDGTVGDTNYILKTTNGGNNWNIIYSVYRDLSRVIFLNGLTGFVSGGFNSSGSYLIKTIDGGNSWNQITTPAALRINDMSIISEDSLWITSNFFTYSLYSSINGGASWDLKYTTGSRIEKIYIDKNYGFLGNQTELLKSTNYGNNWTLIPSQRGFSYMFFVDSLKGWKSYDSMKMTTDGGNTWNSQNILIPGGSMNGSFASFSNIGKDTIWGGGVIYEFPNLQGRGVIHLTTNGGLNWFFQIPDTSLKLPRLYFSSFYNFSTGWEYSVSKGVHTKTGGDSIFYPITRIRNENNYTSEYFQLYQNYPNPFNPATKILYELKHRGKVLLKVYNSLGKEIKTLVDKNQITGNYEVDFEGSGYSSGVYFYSLFIDNERIDTKKMILLR